MNENLAARQTAILEELGKSNGWLTRLELAERLGRGQKNPRRKKANRKQLNPTDVAALALLEAQGQIETASDVIAPGGLGKPPREVYRYRLAR